MHGGRVDFSNLRFRENLANENVQGYISRNFFQFEFRHDQYGLSQWEFFFMRESFSTPELFSFAHEKCSGVENGARMS